MTVIVWVYVPVAVKVSTRSVAKPLAAVEVSRVMPVPADVIVNTFVPTPKTVLSRRVAPRLCVVVMVVAVLVSNLTEEFTVTFSRNVEVSPNPSVAIMFWAYVPDATVGETTSATEFAVVVSRLKPDLSGDIENDRELKPSAAVKVSLRPPTPAPIARDCDVGYVLAGDSVTP